MGDLYRALGQGDKAREAYANALQIAERLAQAEPDRADYQRDLSVSHERMGALYSALGIEREARSLGYSVASATSEQLTENRTTKVLEALTGKLAGSDRSPRSRVTM